MRPTVYRRNARGPGDRQAFERIRLQAGELFDAGRSQAEVARELSVARQNVSRWHALHGAGPARLGTPPACLSNSLPTSGRRSGRAPARMGSTPTAGPWPGSPR
jgi:hypothetical protein